MSPGTFQTAAQLLADETPTVPLSTGDLEAAERLLSELNYDPPRGGMLQEAALNQHRATLLRLAGRADDCFRFPLPHAPGAHFFGAPISPQSYGVSVHGAKKSGAAGRGMTFAQSFESCMGEAAEFLSFMARPDDPLVHEMPESHGLSVEELNWSAAGLGMEAISNPHSVEWVTAQDLASGRKVAFPAGLVLRFPEAGRGGRRQAESNGCGAGPTLKQALFSGLSEVLERDAIALWWFGGKSARRVSERYLEASGIADFSVSVRRGSDRPVRFLDLSIFVDCQVFAALSASESGEAVVCGFACHPDAAIALRSAFLEMCQMELAQELAVQKQRHLGEDALQEQDRVWLKRRGELNYASCPQFTGGGEAEPAHGSTAKEPLECLLERLEQEGFSAYGIDLSRPGIDVPVARVLVPSMQSCKVDWRTPRLVQCAQDEGVELGRICNQIAPI